MTAPGVVTDALDTISLGEAVIIVTAIVTAFLTLRKALPALRRLGHLVDDLAGEPARPGTPARPSLMERVARMEVRVTRIENQMLPNGGNSLRDRVDLLTDQIVGDDDRP